jgi:hypothetical protein
MMSVALCFLLLQAVPVPPVPPVPQAAPPVAPPGPADQPPSLDDALGLEPEGGVRKVPEDGSELDRSLSGAKPRDILASAIEDMRRSARLLDAQDPGLTTRRAQESVVRKLDELIATARRMQEQEQQRQQQQGQAKQQQRRNQGQNRAQQQDQQGQQEPREDGQEQGGRDRNQPTPGEGRDRRTDGDANAQEPPTALDPAANDLQFDESRAEWGRLPPRVREAVRQGLRDPMSAAYRRLTQEYYKRLAEEPRR